MTYWVSCEKFTIRVEVEHGRITKAAPIARRFVGQQFTNLLKWAAGLGGLMYQDID